MCTVSWCRPDRQGYSLFFNRDEHKERLPAAPPSKRIQDGITFLSPTDADHGGSWLVTNELGVTSGLLNHYSATEPFTPARPISRGHLVLSLAGADSAAAVGKLLGQVNPTSYRPFLVFSVDPHGSKLWVWDGRQLSEKPPALPLTTSSYRGGEVTDFRRRKFAALGENPDPEKLSGFHQAHDPLRPESSVRMRRDEARTVSCSRIDVTGDSVSFAYRPEPDDSLLIADAVRITISRKCET